ncbi:UvrD/REP helicase [Desulfovibrionales bacterium]
MFHFTADLHVHSRFSRATSRSLTLQHLAAWAQLKGIDVLATGDLTHPGWREELARELEPDSNNGLLRLKEPTSLDTELLQYGPLTSRHILFMLQGEISSIYKHDGAVRKIHNLVYMPHFEAAERFCCKLEKIGNLTADGRPILGLNSRHLLEIVLETDPLAFLIPAHIWTPWFSLFGSRSGFDTVEECFDDLSTEVFALETGLSSDPDMNWLWSSLDRFQLISNSDAHSEKKLGRELNLFGGNPSYEGIYSALRGESLDHRFLGTVEFFPEEGKYHLDGHRTCRVALDPRDTLERRTTCPICSKKLTLGSLHRVLALADRHTPVQPAGHPGFVSFIPLAEILGEVLNIGPNTKGVRQLYIHCLRRFGSELAVLRDAPREELAQLSPLLAEGIDRMRHGEVIKTPGFDGQYGTIHVFSAKEKRELYHGLTLMTAPAAATVSRYKSAHLQHEPTSIKEFHFAPPDDIADTASTVAPNNVVLHNQVDPTANINTFQSSRRNLNPAQIRAVKADYGPVLVIAGPGTGKTHTLLNRIAHLLEQGIRPHHILAVTFTRKAAQELSRRLLEYFGYNTTLSKSDTLHALAFDHWRQTWGKTPVVLSEESARRAFRESNPKLTAKKCQVFYNSTVLARERLQSLSNSGDPEDIADALCNYIKFRKLWNLVDYTDLLEFWLKQITQGIYISPYIHVLVDEIQDLSPLQLAVVTALTQKATGELDGHGFFAIGDPNQAIYAFRGGLADIDIVLRARWPHCQVISLEENYRSGATILGAAARLIPATPRLIPKISRSGHIHIFEAPNNEAEAAWIGRQVRRLVGISSHSLTDSDRDAGSGISNTIDNLEAAFNPGEVVVLVRIKTLMPMIKRAILHSGIPCSVPESEAFWHEPRTAMILAAAARLVGMDFLLPRPADGEHATLTCPEMVLAEGPKTLATYLKDTPPFDRLYWQSQAYIELLQLYTETNSWVGLINKVNLINDLELVAQKSEKVRIMSLHAAKGLEFGAVFLPALEEGILPFAGLSLLANANSPTMITALSEDLAEERRLFYVGLTRSKEALFLSHATSRQLHGRMLRLPRSRFLKPILAEVNVLPGVINRISRSTLTAKSRHKEKQLNFLD